MRNAQIPAVMRAAGWTIAAAAVAACAWFGGTPGFLAALGTVWAQLLPGGSFLSGVFVLAANAWGGAGAGLIAVAGLATHTSWGARFGLYYAPLGFSILGGVAVAAAPPAGGPWGLDLGALAWAGWGLAAGSAAAGALKGADVAAGIVGMIPPAGPAAQGVRQPGAERAGQARQPGGAEIPPAEGPAKGQEP